MNEAREADLADVLAALARAGSVLVTSHARPDGDAIGSVLAMAMILRQMGKTAEMTLSDRVPLLYRSLPGAGEIRRLNSVTDGYDAVVLLECDSVERTRLRGLDNRLLINIDHHASGRRFADINWIDTTAAAVAEMVYRLARAAAIRITPEIAACLYTAVLTDTGSFCYEGTDAHTFELAADLVRRGADPVRIARMTYFSNPLSKMKLLGTALANLHQDGPLCWLWVTTEDMKQSGAIEEDCEGIVNYAISIEGVEIATFLRELPNGAVRMSMRSKGAINVAAIAEAFGGGGHENASGCTLPGPLAQARARVLDYLRQEVSFANSASPHSTRSPEPHN